MFLAKVGKGSW